MSNSHFTFCCKTGKPLTLTVVIMVTFYRFKDTWKLLQILSMERKMMWLLSRKGKQEKSETEHF